MREGYPFEADGGEHLLEFDLLTLGAATDAP
jgi:hypothetical protein